MEIDDDLLQYKKWNKPWTDSQLQKYYICNFTTTIDELSKLSNRHRLQIARLITEQKWKDLRDNYIKGFTQNKIDENLLNSIVNDNLRVHELERKLASSAIKLKLNILDKINDDMPLDKLLSALKFLNAPESNYWSLILNRSTQSINNAVGLSYYVDINSAFRRLEGAGYQIINPADIPIDSVEDDK